MNRRSPPWGAIEAFVAAARFGSFKAAAEQLGLSAPAFSRRIQTLEAHVGTKLFDRTMPIPSLTPAGRRYLLRLEPGYEAVRAATEWMMPMPQHRPLRVGVSQSLAISWLVPRLNRLHEAEKGLQVALHTRSGNVDLAGGSADVGIIYGNGDWPELVSHKLFELEAFVVCAPALLAGSAAPRSVDDLSQQQLLEALHPPDLWRVWLERAGGQASLVRERHYFDSIQVLYEAAASGLGLAIGVRPLVDQFLAEGRLVAPFPGAVRLPGAYYLAALPHMRRESAVQAFWRWVASEAAPPNQRPAEVAR